MCAVAVLLSPVTVSSKKTDDKEKRVSKPKPKQPFDWTSPSGAKSCCGRSESLTPVTSPDYETYKLTATYFTLREGLTTTLMFNNKGPEAIVAVPTIYSLSGTRFNPAPITVPATSYMDVDMAQLLGGAPDEFREGNMKIAYQGGKQQLGAQVRMIDSENDLIWAEQFVYTTKFISNKLETAWWLPFENSQTRVVVTNTSSATITAAISVDGTSPQQSGPLQIALAPWESRVLQIMRDIVGHENGHVHEKGGISITHSGAPGAVLARMFVAKPNKGYSAATSFIDPDAAASQSWHGNGFRFRNVNGAKLDPVIAVRNTGTQTSQLSGRISYTRPNGDAATIEFPTKTVGAGNTKLFELSNLIDSANVPDSVKYGSIEIDYTTPKGTIIPSVQSVSQNGNHVFQVPMFDPQAMPTSAAGFPWKADGDYTTLVYIKNETDTPQNYVAHLMYQGGAYSTGLKELAAGQTVAVDFRELRDSQTPDDLGNIIPLNIDKGQIGYSARSSQAKTLSARSEQISVADGFASTYACVNCCDNTYYDSYILPLSTALSIGGTTEFLAFQQDQNCYQQPLPAYNVGVGNWSSTAPSVASIAYDGMAEGESPGQATIQAEWGAQTWFMGLSELCIGDTVNVFEEAPVEVKPNVTIDSFLAVGKNETATVRVTVSNNPNGMNITLALSPQSGSGVAQFASNNGTTRTITQTTDVEIRGITESSTANNMRLIATMPSGSSLDNEDFTVISVSLEIKITGSVSSDNSASSTLQSTTGTTQLGGPTLSSASPPSWMHQIEVSGTILPTNFSESIILKREVLSNRRYFNTTLDSSLGCNGGVPTPCDDTSQPEFRDDNPQSGSSQGKVFDLDSPGFNLNSGATVGLIMRRRTNFRQWATISQKQAGTTTDVRVSAYINWFQRMSVVKTTPGSAISTDVTNDNVIGSGTTALSWNLQ